MMELVNMITLCSITSVGSLPEMWQIHTGETSVNQNHDLVSMKVKLVC